MFPRPCTANLNPPFLGQDTMSIAPSPTRNFSPVVALGSYKNPPHSTEQSSFQHFENSRNVGIPCSESELEHLNLGFRQVYLVENFLPLHMTVGRVRIRAVAHNCKAWGLLMLRVWRIKSRTRRFIASRLPVVVGRFNFGYLR
jgi:hypothetical protein